MVLSEPCFPSFFHCSEEESPKHLQCRKCTGCSFLLLAPLVWLHVYCLWPGGSLSYKSKLSWWFTLDGTWYMGNNICCQNGKKPSFRVCLGFYQLGSWRAESTQNSMQWMWAFCSSRFIRNSSFFCCSSRPSDCACKDCLFLVTCCPGHWSCDSGLGASCFHSTNSKNELVLPLCLLTSMDEIWNWGLVGLRN